MRLTVITPDSLFEQEVDPSMEVQDVHALIEAETGLPAIAQQLSNDSGVVMADLQRSLESYGLTGQSGIVFLTLANDHIPPVPSSSSAPPQAGFPSTDADLERMRLQALGDPRLMSDLRNNDPEMATAIQAGTQQFKDAFMRQQLRMRQAALEKDRQIEALNADPYDIEAQKKIEEAIRMEAVIENMQHAMEYSPEAFGNVTMLYIDVEVNGHPVKAFVDSGAQSTIISPECAETCGIMRLLDKRFAGVALGVGTAKILGKIHSAQIKLGNLHLPCSFSVLEGREVDLLFGLDMLKRHQCCIDLSTNTLRINNTEVPFLAEHELPDKARRREVEAVGSEMGDAATRGLPAGIASPAQPAQQFPGSGHTLGAAPTSGPSGTGTPSATNQFAEAAIETLIGLGAPRDQAIQLLEASGGNVDIAASMMFG